MPVFVLNIFEGRCCQLLGSLTRVDEAQAQAIYDYPVAALTLS